MINDRTLVAAAILYKLGERRIEITPEDIAEVVAKYNVHARDGEDLMIELLAKRDDAQPVLFPEEHTSAEVASLAARLMHHPDPDVRSLAGSCLTQAPDKPKIEVFSRPECIFNFCPHPVHCADAVGGCVSPQAK